MGVDRTVRMVGVLLAVVLVSQGCGDDDGDDPAAALFGSWATDLGPLGHEGFSHITFSSDGTFESDLEFVVAGSDCVLDRTTTGTFEADETTVTLLHESGTQAVRQCTGDNEAANHDERATTAEEISESNAVGELMWTVDSGVLTLTDGAGLVRTYTPLS